MIRRYRVRNLLLGCAVASIAVGAATLAALAEPSPRQLWYDPNQLPSISGQLERFLLTPRGHINGLLLADGTQVAVPLCTTGINTLIKPGDALTIHGLKARATPFFSAASLTNTTSGQAVDALDGCHPGGAFAAKGGGDAFAAKGGERRGPGNKMRPAQSLQKLEAHGTIAAPLYGPHAEIRGVLLQDGTTLDIPPLALTPALKDRLSTGATVFVRGRGVRNEYGTAIQVQALGASATDMTELKPSRPPRRHGPPPPAQPAQPTS